jgi:Bacterial conjugation TrbI-like protein
MRFLREHIGLQKCARWVKERPGQLIGIVVLAGVGFWYLSGWIPSTAPRQRAQTPVGTRLVTPLPTQRDAEAQAALTEQRDVEALKEAVKKQERETQAQRQLAVSKDNEAKQERAAILSKVDSLEKRLAQGQSAQAATKSTPKAATPVRTGPTPREKQLEAQLAKLTQGAQPQVTGHGEKYGTMQSYEAKHQNVPVPPSPTRADTPYLGIGCVGAFTLATGGDTTIQTDRSRPVLLTINEPFQCAGLMRGPDRSPAMTYIPVQGCVALAAVRADMSAGRAIGETTHLACVMPDHSYFERPFRAYLVDADGNLGLIGEVVRHASAKIFAAALSSVMAEASALLTAARSSLVVTGQGNGGQQYFSGIQTGFNQMTTFFLEQARNLTPTVFVHRGQRGYIVVLEGLPMEGTPMVNVVSRGREE